MVMHIVRQAKRACGQRIVKQFCHLCDFCRRRGAIPSVHAHRGEAQRDVPDIAGIVQRNLHVRFEGLAILRPRRPIPRHILLERADGDVFEEGEDAHDFIARLLGRVQRGHGEAAIAEDHRRRAIAGERIEIRLPPHRRVIMGVAFDEAGGDDAAIGVEHALPTGGKVLPDFGDHTIFNAHICGKCGSSGSIDNGAVLDQDIAHPLLHFLVFGLCGLDDSGAECDANSVWRLS